jgi:hypothetical protein
MSGTGLIGTQNLLFMAEFTPDATQYNALLIEYKEKLHFVSLKDSKLDWIDSSEYNDSYIQNIN